MKTLLLFSLIGLVTACNDAPLRRHSACKNAYGKGIACASDALSVSEFRKKFIAEVTVPAKVGQKTLIFSEAHESEDWDQEYQCKLTVESGAQFNYLIESGVVTLTSGLTTLKFKKTNGLASEGLIGTWAMVEDDKTVQTVTELIINDLDEIRIRKTCNLR